MMSIGPKKFEAAETVVEEWVVITPNDERNDEDLKRSSAMPSSIKNFAVYQMENCDEFWITSEDFENEINFMRFYRLKYIEGSENASG